MNIPVQFRTSIPPLLEEEDRPLWSVMIPTYNCTKYLRETLTRVLAQDLGSEIMQIEVIDDCSLDDPAAIVEELGQGRVSFFQQPRNVGHTKNFDTALKRARGKLVHLLHGDDYVLDGFYRKMQKAFEQKPKIGAAFCRQIFIDEQGHCKSISDLEQEESGILDNWLERMALGQIIMTPSIVVRRDAYEKLGGFDHRLICAEDWEMWVRIAAHYSIWYEPEPLAAYRMHFNSNTGRHIRSGEDMHYTREAIEIFKHYLPEAKADVIVSKAKQAYAFSTLDMAYSLLIKPDLLAGIAQIREALQFSFSLNVIKRLALLLKRTIAYWARWLITRAISLRVVRRKN